jgi:hypothetical protein
MGSRYIVCGCRDWISQAAVDTALSELLEQDPSFTLIHGGCATGADRMAHDWAKRHAHAVTVIVHPAEWERGRAAGPLRNEQMAAAGAVLCIAFWDGESRGTADMIRRAVKHSIPVRIVPKP